MANRYIMLRDEFLAGFRSGLRGRPGNDPEGAYDEALPDDDDEQRKAALFHKIIRLANPSAADMSEFETLLSQLGGVGMPPAEDQDDGNEKMLATFGETMKQAVKSGKFGKDLAGLTDDLIDRFCSAVRETLKSGANDDGSLQEDPNKLRVNNDKRRARDDQPPNFPGRSLRPDTDMAGDSFEERYPAAAGVRVYGGTSRRRRSAPAVAPLAMDSDSAGHNMGRRATPAPALASDFAKRYPTAARTRHV